MIYNREEVNGYDMAYVELKSGEKLVFQTLTCSGVKSEGQRHAAMFSTAELAVSAYAQELQKYLLTRPGKVHWRHRPEITRHEVDWGPYKEDWYVVYSRIYVGDFDPAQVKERA